MATNSTTSVSNLLNINVKSIDRLFSVWNQMKYQSFASLYLLSIPKGQITLNKFPIVKRPPITQSNCRMFMTYYNKPIKFLHLFQAVVAKGCALFGETNKTKGEEIYSAKEFHPCFIISSSVPLILKLHYIQIRILKNATTTNN